MTQSVQKLPVGAEHDPSSGDGQGSGSSTGQSARRSFAVSKKDLAPFTARFTRTGDTEMYDEATFRKYMNEFKSVPSFAPSNEKEFEDFFDDLARVFNRAMIPVAAIRRHFANIACNIPENFIEAFSAVPDFDAAIDTLAKLMFRSKRYAQSLEAQTYHVRQQETVHKAQDMVVRSVKRQARVGNRQNRTFIAATCEQLCIEFFLRALPENVAHEVLRDDIDELTFYEVCDRATKAENRLAVADYNIDGVFNLNTTGYGTTHPKENERQSHNRYDDQNYNSQRRRNNTAPERDGGRDRRDNSCRKCRQEGHWARYCPLNSNGNRGARRAPECKLCLEKGHWTDKCPRLPALSQNHGLDGDKNTDRR